MLSDAAVVGAPIISESNFGDGFRDDFDTLDLETSAAVGNRTGKWKKGFIHANMAEFGFTYGSDENPGDNFVHAAINNEEQVYVDNRKPPPSGVNPYTLENGALKITSAPVLPQDSDWARVKDAYLNPDGTRGQFVRNKPVKYTSGMVSTYGRFAMSFGRFRARVKTPYGAVGNSNDINQRSAVFPAALWSLMDIPYGADINGDPFADGRTTYRGGRPNGGGINLELDGDENFGESATAIHQTTHFHPAGTPQGNNSSSPRTIETGADLRNVWRETGYDVFPEKIAFFVNGVYTHIVDTPDEIRNGLPKYVPNPSAPFDPIIDAGNVARTDGRQQHADGSTRYMCHVIIMNLARDGKFPRDLAKLVHDDPNNSLPPHSDTVSMLIDWVEARPLLVDNPDNFPMRINGVPVQVDGSTGGVDTPSGNPASTNAGAYRPVLGDGVRFTPSHGAGIVEYYLTNPDEHMPGHWNYDDYGTDATLIGSATESRLRLQVARTASRTPRLVRWVPDSQ